MFGVEPVGVDAVLSEFGEVQSALSTNNVLQIVASEHWVDHLFVNQTFESLFECLDLGFALYSELVRDSESDELLSVLEGDSLIFAPLAQFNLLDLAKLVLIDCEVASHVFQSHWLIFFRVEIQNKLEGFSDFRLPQSHIFQIRLLVKK